MPITPEFFTDLEVNMRSLTSNEYKRLNTNTWWRKVAKVSQLKSKKDLLVWLLETARIRRPNAAHGGGQQIFDDMMAIYTEIEAQNANTGLLIKLEQFEDLYNGIVGGEGLALAASWSRQVGAYSGYWPQEELYQAIHANVVGYDGLTFFHGSHPNNVYDASAGTYANVFTGAASGYYPGALKIDASVTVDVAVANLSKALAYIGVLKGANGKTPRNLRAKYLFHPPALTARAQTITQAKFIAQAAASGGGSVDMEAVIKGFGLAEPVCCPELAEAFGGSDTTWYLGMEDILENELGAWIYGEREPFNVAYHGPQTDAQLSRIREFEWHLHGRNVIAPGHPFLMFQCKAA
jgi:hypothetical protein